jgi:hypothetical protein
MSSSAIVAWYQTLLMYLGLIALIGLCPAITCAESAQADPAGPVQVVSAPQSHADSGATAAGPSTVLKIPTTTVLPDPSNAIVQPVPSTTAPLAAASPASPMPMQSSAASTNTAVPAIGAAATKVASQSQVDGVEFLTPAQRRTYQRAASVFTVFCHDWERLLHEREVNNLEHLSWREDGGLEIATYTGYGKLESCECKASKEGLPIGKIRYDEINYSIAGKTIDEARHAIPKQTHEISTLEIFSWDKGKWFY